MIKLRVMELKIYDKQGLVKMTVSPDNSSQWNHEIGVENVVSVNFTTWEFLVLEAGWYILVEGQKFNIKSEYRPKHINDSKYTYNLKFYGREHDTQDILFCRINQGEDDLESVFAYDGTPIDFLQKVVDNMNRNTEGVLWKIGETITSGRKTINFNGIYCWDALGEIARTFETEWWLDGEYLNLSKCVRGEPVPLGYGKGLKSGLTQNENTNAVKWFTRLIPVGSSKNIDKNKYGYATLQLPGREKYIDINTQYGLKEYREEAAFSEIYPHRVGTISSVRSEERTNEETGNYTVYYVKDSSLPFNPDEYMIGGEVIRMNFSSGFLSGKDFEVNWNNGTAEFEIINQYPDENSQLPGGNLTPSVGDHYVLSNISMPGSYIASAEAELQEAVDAFLQEYSRDISIYSGNTDYIYIDKHNVPLKLGQRVKLLSDQYFGNGERISRIYRVSRKLNNLGDASLDCSDAISSSWKSSVDSSLNQLQFSAAQEIAQSVIRILKSGDTEKPSEYNVFSARRSINTFLSKLTDDTASGLITFLRGLVSKGITETDDVIVNEAIHSKEFVSGFTAGKGWAVRMKEYLNSVGVAENRSVAEFDDLIVRGTIRVFEFIVSQMLGENDNRTFTGMMEVDHYDEETGKVWLDTQDGKLYNTFRKDDIILVQQYNGMPSEDNNFYVVKQYELIIDEVGVGDLSLGEGRLDWVTFRNFASPMEGATKDIITKGDTFVRIDNLTDPNRKGIMQIMTVGEDTPYMDVIYGKKTDPENALKSRFGNLQGVYNHLFGWLKDFGAYIANLYAVGEFRIAHTGEDVADKIEMVKGAFRTNFSKTYFELKDEANFLFNGSFSGDMEGWILGESDTDFLLVDGKAIYANRNMMTANSKFVGRSVYNDLNVLRIFNSHIMQKNETIRKFGTHKEFLPMDGSEDDPSYEFVEKKDKAYLTIRFYCDTDGEVEIGFDNGEISDYALPFIRMDVTKRTEEYLIEAEGIWNNEGDFIIRSTADIYVEYVLLSDRPLENLKTTTETWMEQDAGRIALLGQKIDDTNNSITDLGIELNAEKERIDLYVTKTQTLESSTKTLESRITLSEARIDAVAGSIETDAYGNITNISKSGLVLDSEFASLFSSEVNKQGVAKSAELDLYVLADDLEYLVSKIDISADQINLSGAVTYTDLSDNLQDELDGKATSSDLSALRTSLNKSISDLNSTVDLLQTEVNEKATTAALTEYVTQLNNSIKDKADKDLSNAVVNGYTFIYNGLIRTNYIDVDNLVVKNLEATKGNYTYSLDGYGYQVNYTSASNALVHLTADATNGTHFQLYNTSNNKWVNMNPGHMTIASTSKSLVVDIDSSYLRLNGGMVIRNFGIDADYDFTLVTTSSYSLTTYNVHKGMVKFIYFTNECSVSGLAAGTTKCKYGTIFVYNGSSWYHFSSKY